MTEDEAYKRLRALLVAANQEAVALDPDADLLQEIIHSHQTAPKPEGSYAEITPLGSRDSGEGFRRCYDTVQFNGEERVVELRTQGVAYGFRVDVYASRAADHCRAMVATLWSARAQLDLLPLVVAEVGNVVSRPEIEQQHIVGRANFTLTLNGKRTQRTLIDVIERGHIGLSGEGGGKPTPITANIDYQKD